MKYIIILLVATIGVMLSLALYSQKPPDALGISEGRLYDCPESDNCVSSQALSKSHYIDPLQIKTDTDKTMGHLQSVIEGMEGATVVEMKEEYLRAEFSSPLWHFVDDLECLYDDELGLIHIRSASRVGHSDFGSNRKRVEALRKLIEPRTQ